MSTTRNTGREVRIDHGTASVDSFDKDALRGV